MPGIHRMRGAGRRLLLIGRVGIWLEEVTWAWVLGGLCCSAHAVLFCCCHVGGSGLLGACGCGLVLTRTQDGVLGVVWRGSL